MKMVIIKYRSPTIDHEYMPLFLYTEPLKVIKEDEKTITVQHNNSEFYTYKFDKKYIEKSI